MSWQVEGRYYHDYAAYQKALAESRQKQAETEVETLRREATRHEQRAQRVEQELTAARGDAEKLAALRQELQAGLADVRRVNDRAASAQGRFRRQTDEALARLRAEAADARTDTAALEAQFRREADEVGRKFERARADLRTGLADAERRRAATESRIAAEVAAVDAKVEADRAARLERARSDADRAAGLVRYAEERLSGLDARQEALDLRADVTRLRERLGDARQCLDRGDPTTGLALATTAYSDVRAAEKEAADRAGYLAAAQARVRETADHLTQVLGADDVRDGVRAYFGAAAARVAAELRAVTAALPETHTQYHRRDRIEAADERLRRLEEVTAAAVAAVPGMRDLDVLRRDRIGRVIGEVVRQLGPSQECTIAPVEPDNHRSPVRVRLRYATGVYDLHFPLAPDDPIDVEGYEHVGKADCEQSARVFAKVLADLFQLTGQQTDAEPRPGPQLHSETRSAPGGDVDTRLRELGGSS